MKSATIAKYSIAFTVAAFVIFYIGMNITTTFNT